MAKNFVTRMPMRRLFGVASRSRSIVIGRVELKQDKTSLHQQMWLAARKCALCDEDHRLHIATLASIR